MRRDVPSPSPPVIRFNVGSEKSFYQTGDKTVRKSIDKNIEKNSIILPSPASSSSNSENLDEKFNKIEEKMGQNAERSDSILMNNIDSNDLARLLSTGKIKHSRDYSGESLEKVPEEYIGRTSELISLDNESQFFNQDEEGEEEELDFSPSTRLW